MILELLAENTLGLGDIMLVVGLVLLVEMTLDLLVALGRISFQSMRCELARLAELLVTIYSKTQSSNFVPCQKLQEMPFST